MVLWWRNPDRSVTADESRYWANSSGGGSLHADVTVTSSGYDSTNGWTASSVNGEGVKYPRSIADTLSFRTGFRLKLSSLPAATRLLCAAVDATGAVQVSAYIHTDGKVRIYRGDSGGTLLETSLSAVATATWYKVGFKGLVDQLAGSAEVHIDGAEFVRINNVDTAAQTTAAWRGIKFGLSSEWILGHAYIGDASGTRGTDLIPGAYVKNLGPTADGAYADWSEVGAASMAAAVDDTDPNDDTDYIKTDTTDANKFSLQMTALATTTRVIYGVQQTNMVRNLTGSGVAPTHELLAVLDGDYVDDWQSASDSEWRVLQRVLTLNPRTGLPFTPTEINDGRWGGRLNV